MMPVPECQKSAIIFSFVQTQYRPWRDGHVHVIRRNHGLGIATDCELKINTTDSRLPMAQVQHLRLGIEG